MNKKKKDLKSITLGVYHNKNKIKDRKLLGKNQWNQISSLKRWTNWQSFSCQTRELSWNRKISWNIPTRRTDSRRNRKSEETYNNSEIESVIKNLSTERNPVPIYFTSEFYQHLKEKVHQCFSNCSKSWRVGTLPNSLYMASIILIPKPDKHITRKLQTYTPDE